MTVFQPLSPPQQKLAARLLRWTRLDFRFQKFRHFPERRCRVAILFCRLLQVRTLDKDSGTLRQLADFHQEDRGEHPTDPPRDGEPIFLETQHNGGTPKRTPE